MISMRARPELNSITMENTYTNVYGGYNNQKLAVLPSTEVGFEITLRPYVDPDTSIQYTLKIDN